MKLQFWGLSRDKVEAEGKGVTANGYRVLGGSDKNILNLIVVMVSQLCGYTKNQGIVYFP